MKNQRHYFANKCLTSQSFGFSGSHVWMWELDYKESWAPKNRCFWTVVLEKTLESLLDSKEIQPVHSKGNQSWVFIGRTDDEAKLRYFGHMHKEPTHWKRPWYWERLKVGGEGDDRGPVGWMGSLTQCTGVWVNFRSWLWTGRPGMLQSMGSQRVRYDWVTELNLQDTRREGWPFWSVSSKGCSIEPHSLKTFFNQSPRIDMLWKAHVLRFPHLVASQCMTGLLRVWEVLQ